MKVWLYLSSQQVRQLEEAADAIGGVSARDVLRKATREWQPVVIGVKPQAPPKMGQRDGLAPRFRVDLRVRVEAKALANYRARYDKIGLRSDGLLMREFLVPVFAAHLNEIIRQLRE